MSEEPYNDFAHEWLVIELYRRASHPNGLAKLIRYLVNHGSCKVLCHKLTGGTFRPITAQNEKMSVRCVF